ncbi:MAG: hypothetical protein NZ951_02530 [Dehalococcoidia bacterium]|nr:hypothetical protein [Dehalococcoidia bacterium]MDW8119836.1 hypothetical protein [Chloroflexota bacterium]
MGLVKARGWIGRDREHLHEMEFLVDTGSFYTLLPPHRAAALGIALPLTGPVVLADRRTVSIPLDMAYLRLQEREAAIPVGVSEVPMPLLGVTALEALGLAVDPVSGRLEPTRPFGPAALGQVPPP